MVGLCDIPEKFLKKQESKEQDTEFRRLSISKDTLDIQITRCESTPSLKSCILISTGDGSNEKVSVKKAKSVHFADASGKPLKSVKTLVDPTDDLFGLNFLSLRSSTRRSFSANKNKNVYQVNVNQDKGECLNFKQPIEFKDLRTRVENENVCLDKISFIRGNGIFGTVVVKNICFQKDVSVRYSIDNWETEHTETAKYVAPSCVENADTFSFEIVLTHMNNPVNLMFAICFKAVDGMSFWDSNFGNNYSVIYRTDKGNEYSDSPKGNGFILPKQNFIGWAT